MKRQQKFIVELEGYEGDVSALYVTTRADDMPGPGKKMYCVGELNDRGVVALIDCGYSSLEELLKAWDGEWENKIDHDNS